MLSGERTHPSGTFVHQLPSGGSSGVFHCLFHCHCYCFCCSSIHPFVLDCFISTDSFLYCCYHSILISQCCTCNRPGEVVFDNQMGFCYAGAAIAYKSKLQTVIATSSTEAKIIAAVHTAKTARYQCSILKDLRFAQEHPMVLCEDNQAAITMINQ